MAVEKLTDARCLEQVVGEDDLVAFGESLDASGKIDRLAEVVEPAVERHSEAGAGVRAHLQRDQLFAGLRVEARDPGVHVERRPHRIAGIAEARHHRVADRLHERSGVTRDRLAQEAEVESNEVERLHVSDALVHRRGALDVGEQEREAPYLEALGRDDRLRCEEVEKRLVRENLRRGQERTHRPHVVAQVDHEERVPAIGRVREVEADAA